MKTETRSTLDETTLSERFLAGDDNAFRELFARHNGRLLAFCVKFVKDVPVAEDLTQETWIRTIDLRGRKEEDADGIRNLLGMIYRIARNLCLDHLKAPRTSGRVSLDGIGEAHHPSATLREMSTEEEIVLRALDRLPIDYREPLVLNIYCGYSYEEIARMLEKTPDAIWARASRGRKKLREIVTEELRREEHSLKVITDHRQQRNVG